MSLVTSDPSLIAEAATARKMQDLDAYILVNQPDADVITRRGIPLDTAYRPLKGSVWPTATSRASSGCPLTLTR